MSDSAAADPGARPRNRYGSAQPPRRPRRRAVFAMVVISVIVGIPIAIFGYQRMHARSVRGDLFGYQVIDAETVSVTITVTRPDPRLPAVCIVRARAADGGETGRREVLVAPSSEPIVQVTTVLKSARPPLVGDIYGCGIDVPEYLRPG